MSITQDESSDYLAKRTLKRGSAGWVLLAGLGVSYVISGDYSGWNFGLAQGGFGGLLIAACRHRRHVPGAWCWAWPRCPRRCRPPAAATPSPGARSGPWGGFATGTAILIEYAIAPAAIATFIGAYVESLDCSASPTAGGCTWRPTPSSSAST